MGMVTTHINAKPQHLSLFGPWGFSTMLEWSIHSVASECDACVVLSVRVAGSEPPCDAASARPALG